MQRLPLIQLIKYSIVGAANTAITFFTYMAMMAVGVHYLPAAATGYLLGSANSYLLNYRWTFDARGISHRQTLSRFAFVQTVGVTCNLGLIYALVHDARIAKPPAQLLTTILLLAITFALSRLWAFSRPATAAAPVRA